MRKSSSDRLFMLKDGVSSTGHLIQGMCIRALGCKSKMTDPFEWVFIPPIKVTAWFFAPIKVGGIPTV